MIISFKGVAEVTGYRTVRAKAEAVLTERRSRFVAAASPAGGQEEAECFIASVREAHKTASHNVYAYVIDSGHMRASDDGEPSGTAGTPVLEVLKKESLTRTAIVVSRYFGGVLLGAGGLVRAYGAAARLAVEAAGVVTMTLCSNFRMSAEYRDASRLQSAFPALGAVVTDTAYTDRVCFSFYVPAERAGALVTALTDLTGGKLAMEPQGREFRPVPGGTD